MNEFVNELNLQDLWSNLEVWFGSRVLNLDTLLQAVAILALLIIGHVIGLRFRRTLSHEARHHGKIRQGIDDLLDRVTPMFGLLASFALLLVAVAAASRTNLVGNYMIGMAATLTGTWIIIRFATGFIRNKVIARLITWLALIFAVLVVLGLSDPTITLMDRVGMTFGEVRVSLLSVAKGILALGVLLWVVKVVSGYLERIIGNSEHLTPSAQVLISKISRIVLITLVILVTIGSLGIDLSALAIFGGALGIGVGIGLQGVVSNLVSGMLLLMDKSIKPNDVIAIGQTYGWVAKLGARYTAIRTRDGIEFLIPNEELITQRVENWSHSDSVLRLKIPIGVSYDCDLPLAIRLCIQAAAMTERVINDPAPSCLVRGFGDSAVNLEIRLWIDDPARGRANVTSQVLLQVWDLFHENNIEIPYPQRDLHLKSSALSPPSTAGFTATDGN